MGDESGSLVPDPSGFRIEVYRPGEGEDPSLVNSVKLIHIPTGTEVVSSTESTQIANRARAVRLMEEQHGIRVSLVPYEPTHDDDGSVP